MAGSSNELNTCHRTRSLSLPFKSDLINKKIEEQLEKLRIKETSSASTAETISIGLSGLADLYLCINQVLSLPLTQQALSLRKYEKCVSEQLKVCSDLQNICTIAKEIMLQQKQIIGDLLSALSAHNEGSSSTSYESKMAKYISSRKEVIKRAMGLARSLKELVNDDSFGSSRLFEKEHHRSSAVTKALTCVSIINASVYESLLFFLSSPVSKPTLGSRVSKVIHKSSSKSSCHAKSGNEFTDLDIALQSLGSRVNDQKVQNAQQRLKDLLGVIQGFESSLDNACMQLTETKACLMNIVSF